MASQWVSFIGSGNLPTFLPTFNSATTRVGKIEVVDEDVDFRRARLVTRNGESCDEVVLVHLMQGLRHTSWKTRQFLLNGGQHFGKTRVQREHYTHAITVAPRKSSHELSNNLVKRARATPELNLAYKHFPLRDLKVWVANC